MRKVVAVAVFLVGAAVLPVQAYRPFSTSDATVIPKGTFSLEAGAARAVRENADDTSGQIDAVLSYGLSERVKANIGASYATEGVEGFEHLFIGRGAGIVAMLREGVMQGKEGASLALGLTALIPSSGVDEECLGWNATGMASLPAGPFTAHLNGGIENGRTASGPDVLWGGQLDYPLSCKFMLAAELGGRMPKEDAAQTFATFGAVWCLGPVALDAGVRKGFDALPGDIDYLAGFTWNFP